MSKISDIIFNGEPHRISSPFGKRQVITTSAGKTSSYHQGTDYATYDKRIPQYAIETGYCFASSKAQDGANYVWIVYPRIKKAMFYGKRVLLIRPIFEEFIKDHPELRRRDYVEHSR